ncbi:hypothetical protein LBMAG42_08080 [Deltaproteobacteria bacterium]|nr:hypothetical protein LBMAG42_08080 [Deltaproteobacteria bacterium]
MHRLTVPALLLLITGCDTETADPKETGGDTAVDTGETGDTDTGDTDTDTGDTDTGDTNETGDSGIDTSLPPPPTTGYFGPPALVVLADDGAGAAKVMVIDTAAATSTTITGVTVPKTATFGCAGQYVWVLSTKGDAATPDVAYGVEARNLVIGATIELPAKFDPKAVTYNESFWFAGDGSASVMSYDGAGAEGGSIDLSSVADADGIPEVRAFIPSDAGQAAVLARTGSGATTKSGVAFLDFAALSITGSGDLAGSNAGSAAGGVPGALMINLEASGTSGGALELFDTTSKSSAGNAVDFSGVTRVATVSGGAGDGTMYVAVDDGDAITVHRYISDGTDLGTITTNTIANGLAVVQPYLWSGEGTGTSANLIGYDLASGAESATVAIGSSIYGVAACAPPPMPPNDTGDTAAPPE